MKKVRLGSIHADCLTFDGALSKVEELVQAGRGGYVVTPNVDHVCLAEHDPELRAAYEHAALSLVDGMPLLWLSRLLGHPLPEKISGSDLVFPLIERAARLGWRVYLLGAAPGVAHKAAEELCARYSGLNIVGTDSPPIGFEKEEAEKEATQKKLREAAPQVVLVALGCPKQELLMYRWRFDYAPAVAFGIGASLDFIAGKVKRSPSWMSRAGLEWVYRLSQDPRRLTHRYLVRDREILTIGLRMLRMPKHDRAYET